MLEDDKLLLLMLNVTVRYLKEKYISYCRCLIRPEATEFHVMHLTQTHFKSN